MLSRGPVRYGRYHRGGGRRSSKREDAEFGGGDSEEGRFLANAILCVVGIGLVLSGLYFLSQTSEREPRVNRFNAAVAKWNSTYREEFRRSSFRVMFTECAACDPSVTLVLEPSAQMESFSRAERARANRDVSSYVPLRFVSRSVTGTELRQGAAVMRTPIQVVVEATNSHGQVSRLPVTEPLSLYSKELGHGNEKVCRNEHGEYVGGRCYYRWFLRSMCFSLVQSPVSGEWIYDPETPGLGCDVYDQWSYAQYAKDVRGDDRLQSGDFTFAVTVRHGDDPLIIARDVTNKNTPNFGESSAELWLEGKITLGFGLLVLSAPVFQVYCHWKQKREWQRQNYGVVPHAEEASGLLAEAMEGNWLGKRPKVPNPLDLV
jgi:hypothetical protein